MKPTGKDLGEWHLAYENLEAISLGQCQALRDFFSDLYDYHKIMKNRTESIISGMQFEKFDKIVEARTKKH